MTQPSVAMGGYALTENASLAQRNTLRVDARAKLLAEVDDPRTLRELLHMPAIRSGRVLVLGEGSNILFTRDFDGTVVRMVTRGVETVDESSNRPRVRVAAGERWDDLVRWTLGHGYAGLENLIMIPGTVGAAPLQNIGAYGVEVAEFVECVEAFDRESGRSVELDRDACAFGYRDSTFKRQPQRYVITAVTFALPRERLPRIDYAGISEQLGRMDIARPTPFHIAEAVVQLRTRKLPDPALIGNAGSFFKNPIISTEQARVLQDAHPELPHWKMSDDTQKLSAAWLIEACGFKGLREGDAGISSRHALVLVNHGTATGPQLWTLAQRVMRGVEQRFGVRLEPEPHIV